MGNTALRDAARVLENFLREERDKMLAKREAQQPLDYVPVPAVKAPPKKKAKREPKKEFVPAEWGGSMEGDILKLGSNTWNAAGMRKVLDINGKRPCLKVAISNRSKFEKKCEHCTPGGGPCGGGRSHKIEDFPADWFP